MIKLARLLGVAALTAEIVLTDPRAAGGRVCPLSGTSLVLTLSFTLSPTLSFTFSFTPGVVGPQPWGLVGKIIM